MIENDEQAKNEMIEVIKVAGMPKKKAQTIKKLSEYIQKYYNGNIWNIKKESVDETREDTELIVNEKSVRHM